MVLQFYRMRLSKEAIPNFIYIVKREERWSALADLRGGRTLHR